MDFQVPFSDEQLRKPTAEGIRAVFEQFLEMIVGTSREELSQPVFGAADVFSYPELHEESVAVLSFHRGMHKLFNAAGIPDFCISDYAKPEFPRLRRLLSGLINLTKFREERLLHFQNLNNNSDALVERKNALEQEVASYQAQIEAHNVKVEAEAPKVQQLEEENVSLANELQGLHQRQASLQAEIRTLKTQGNDLSERSASLKVKALHEEQEVAKHQSLVVSSPERVRKEIEEQQDQLEYDREQVASMERRTRELQSRVSGLETTEAEVKKVVLVMEECEREMERSKEQQQIVRDRKQAISIAESDLRRLENQENYLRRQLQSAEDRVVRIQKQMAERDSDVQSTYQRLQEDRSAAERERQAVEARLAQNEALIVSTNQKKIQLSNEFERDMETASTMYRKLEDQVVKYHRQLFASMQLARAM